MAFDVGSIEIIGYDETIGGYMSHFYASQRNMAVSGLVATSASITVPPIKVD